MNKLDILIWQGLVQLNAILNVRKKSTKIYIFHFTQFFITIFTFLRSLKRHNLNHHIMVHTGERPFKCDYCPKRFNHASTVRRHIRTHTGEKPYKCSVCDFRCAQSTVLKTHARFKHNGEGWTGIRSKPTQNNNDNLTQITSQSK